MWHYRHHGIDDDFIKRLEKGTKKRRERERKKTHELVTTLEKGTKKRRERERKKTHELVTRLEKGEKKRKERAEKFWNKIRKGQEKRQKREILEKASITQRMKLCFKWALFGYRFKQNFDYKE